MEKEMETDRDKKMDGGRLRVGRGGMEIFHRGSSGISWIDVQGAMRAV